MRCGCGVVLALYVVFFSVFWRPSVNSTPSQLVSHLSSGICGSFGSASLSLQVSNRICFVRPSMSFLLAGLWQRSQGYFVSPAIKAGASKYPHLGTSFPTEYTDCQPGALGRLRLPPLGPCLPSKSVKKATRSVVLLVFSIALSLPRRHLIALTQSLWGL